MSNIYHNDKNTEFQRKLLYDINKNPLSRLQNNPQCNGTLTRRNPNMQKGILRPMGYKADPINL